MDDSSIPWKMQEEKDASTRTKGLTILARILAASIVRKNPQHDETYDGQDGQVYSSGGDDSETDANAEAGGED